MHAGLREHLLLPTTHTFAAQVGCSAARRISHLAKTVGASSSGALKDFNVLPAKDGGYDSSTILSRPCVAFGMKSDQGSLASSLTAADCAFFAANGFLLKKSLVDAEQCAAAREYLWSRAPPCLRRNDPTTHVDPHLSWEATPAHTHVPSTFMADSASWKLHDCGDAPWMLRLMGANKLVLAHVEGLIGGSIRKPTRTRGIYAVFPSTAHAALSEQDVGRALDPHNDVSAQWLNGTLYLNETLPRSGNLVVVRSTTVNHLVAIVHGQLNSCLVGVVTPLLPRIAVARLAPPALLQLRTRVQRLKKSIDLPRTNGSRQAYHHTFGDMCACRFCFILARQTCAQLWYSFRGRATASGPD